MGNDYMLYIIKGGGTQKERNAFFKQVLENPELAKKYSRLKSEFMLNSLPYKPNSILLFKKQKNKVLLTFKKVAAVLFIPLLAYFAYSILEKEKPSLPVKEIITSYEVGTGIRYTVNNGVKASVILPDSTLVWLNSGTYLDIPHDFTDANREVFLSGEGYFDVKSDPTSPFLVTISEDLVVRVTGTEFNLSCYEDDESMKLTLFSGSLEVIKNKDKVINVNLDEEVVIDYKTLEEEHKIKADKLYISAWKKGFLRFENTNMKEVLKKLERWYGIHIKVEDPEILSYSFTANFDSESLSQVLDLMKIAIGIDYQIETNKVKLYTVLE